MAISSLPDKESPDSRINDEIFEMKMNLTPTVSAIDNELRRTNDARNMLINVKSDIDIDKLEQAITGRLWRTKIEKLVIIIYQKRYEFTREEY